MYISTYITGICLFIFPVDKLVGLRGFVVSYATTPMTGGGIQIMSTLLSSFVLRTVMLPVNVSLGIWGFRNLSLEIHIYYMMTEKHAFHIVHFFKKHLYR